MTYLLTFMILVLFVFLIITKKIINFCIKNNKNILVEKPLIFKDESYLKKMKSYVIQKLFTLHNHRFEPNLINEKIIKKNYW